MVPKLSDFGVSRASAEYATHVSTAPIGTRGYTLHLTSSDYRILATSHSFFKRTVVLDLVSNCMSHLICTNMDPLYRRVWQTSLECFEEYSYLDPDYFRTNQLTTASDVYAFGIVLLEIITGLPVIDYTRLDASCLDAWVRGPFLKLVRRM